MAESIPNPHQRTNLSPRLDWALTQNNTLTARYQYYRDTETNNGVGVLVLPSQGYYSQTTEQTVQISDTQVFGSKIVNETRFQYNRDDILQNPTDTNPAVNVLGSFMGGGAGSGNVNDLQNNYEMQNYTSLIHGNHIIKFGGRLRATQDTNYSTSGFNVHILILIIELPATDTPADCGALGQNPACPISLLYADQQLSGAGGTPYATQLTYTTGLPTTVVTYYDSSRTCRTTGECGRTITLSFGLRFETQNAIHDHGDWAPRLGFAWGVGGRSGPPKVVIRGGYGIFL